MNLVRSCHMWLYIFITCFIQHCVHILMPYNCTHNAFHNIDHHRKCYPFYSSAAALHDSPPQKKNLQKTFGPLFTATGKIRSVVNFLLKHCWTSHMFGSRSKQRGQDALSEGRTNTWLEGWRYQWCTRALYDITHWFLQLCVLAHRFWSTIWTFLISRQFIDRIDILYAHAQAYCWKLF